MRAVLFDEFGGPDVLRIGDAPAPQAGPAQVRIRVRAASVNPADAKARSGKFGPLPFPAIPGFDAAGVVDQVGAGVTSVALGDEVFGLGSATYAEAAVLHSFVLKPTALSWAEAAAVGVAGETANRGLTLLGVASDSTVLIDGAGGGVGVIAVQLAVALGARVIGTASARNHELLASLGATPISYGPHLAQRVAAIAPGGVDRAFDVAGQTEVSELISIAGAADRVLTIANFSADQFGIQVSGGGEVDATQSLQAVAELAATSGLTIPIQQTFSLADAAIAHAARESGRLRGKLVLTIE